MARTTFGGTLADYVVLPESGVYRRPGSVEVTVWSAQTGGTQLTDLLVGGQAAASLRTGSEGLIPAFQGPDGVTEAWYQVAGASQRVRVATGPAGPPGGSDAETAQRVTDGPLTKTALASALPIFGSASPSTYLPAGREYVWFQTDGAGTLIDIVSGVA
ncbi:hypothetical protein [Nocardioides zeae]